MRYMMLSCILSAFLIAVGHIPAQEKQVATTQPNTADRILHSMGSVGGGQRITNRWLIYDQQIIALKAATEHLLQKPTVIASHYCPQVQYRDKGTVQIFLWWIEDKPSLKEIIVRNPETEKELRISIPQSRLDQAERDGERDGVLYGWFDRIPVDFIGDDPTQVLEVRAPDQDIPALCFPADVLADPQNSSTKPAK